MNSWFPLIEGFIAFALTMVALTSVVSALLGIWQRLWHWRSRGLRTLIRFLYQRDVAGQVAAATEVAPAAAPDINSLGKLLKNHGWRGLIQFVFRELVIATASTGAESRFVDDMTRLPSIDPPALDFLKANTGFANSADSLTDAEFLERLRASAVGKAILVQHTVKTETIFAELLSRFTAYGRASTEAFARKSRIGTVVIGFGLALLANIDSFQLLNRYLTDPALTAKVVERSEAILAGELRKADTDAVAVSMDVATTKVGGAFDAALRSLPADATQEIAQLQAARATALGTMGAVQKETSEAISLTMGVVESFPVGWSLYPNCSDTALSIRCKQLQLLAHAPLPNQEAGLVEAICWVWTHDRAGFLRWLIGILITGAMLGLGTPFWVEVVNNFLRGRQLLQGGAQVPQAATPTPTPTPTPTLPLPQK
ncbi:MAG TPA: hypothetical protein VLI06_12165 [Solimonas sp.]|nr:hypothetical protein [Solimonas sp.]